MSDKERFENWVRTHCFPHLSDEQWEDYLDSVDAVYAKIKGGVA